MLVKKVNLLTNLFLLFQIPRAEAVSILGSLLGFPTHLTKLPYFDPNCCQLTITFCPDIKVSWINILNTRWGKSFKKQQF